MLHYIYVVLVYAKSAIYHSEMIQKLKEREKERERKKERRRRRKVESRIERNHIENKEE